MRISYLTCGFVDLLSSAAVCLPLIERSDHRMLRGLYVLGPAWALALDGARETPKAIISYLDPVKRLEAYLAATLRLIPSTKRTSR